MTPAEEHTKILESSSRLFGTTFTHNLMVKSIEHLCADKSLDTLDKKYTALNEEMKSRIKEYENAI